jgi:hypothetical protein
MGAARIRLLVRNLSAVSPHNVASRQSESFDLMSIYAFAVALWFMAVALFFFVALIRSWFRSPRERPVAPSASTARRQTPTIRR